MYPTPDNLTKNKEVPKNIVSLFERSDLYKNYTPSQILDLQNKVKEAALFPKVCIQVYVL